MKYLLIFSLLFVDGYAKIELEDISSKPPCRAKDFMIWQYLKQDITPEQADEAYKQVDNSRSSKLFHAYAKKTDNKDVKYKLNCKNEVNLLAIKDKECLEMAFTPYKVLNYTAEQKEILAKKLDSESKINFLKILNEKNLLDSYESYDSETILTLINSTGQAYRRKNFNMVFDKNFLDYLTSSKKISQLINIAVHDDKLDKLKISLLKIDGENLDSHSNFLLALNSLKHFDKDGAVKYFKLSRSKAKSRIDVDKNNFWIYKITDDKNYLKQLLLSTDINIYNLYAREKMNVEFDNYFCNLETDNNKSEKSLSDPFEWSEILKEIKTTQKEELLNLAQLYKQKDMLPVQAYIVQKANNYNLHGYIMPYDEQLEDLDLDSRALVYALMRQESYMIPSALSHSYALGLMQIMPFVADDISKNIKNPISCYDDMFLPENNIRYSKAHLKWMKKSLYHPLFIAYAYNGGMGFFKKYLLRGKFNSGEYEPFLSMEMMSNEESREYGKKVLANYVMYKKIMGEKVSILHLFDTLTQPKKTDRFRTQG